MSHLRPRTLNHSRRWGGNDPHIKEMIRQNQERPMLERLGYILTEPSDLSCSAHYESLKQQISSAEGVEPYLVSQMNQCNAQRNAIAWDKNHYNQYTCSMIQEALYKWRHAQDEVAKKEMEDAISHKITTMMPHRHHNCNPKSCRGAYGLCTNYKEWKSKEDIAKADALLRMASDRSMITDQMKQTALTEYRLYKQHQKDKADAEKAAKIAAAKQHEEQVKAQMANAVASW